MTEISPAAPTARFILRASDFAGTVFGMALPGTPCRAHIQGSRAVLWLGPDEFLLLLPESEAASAGPEIAAAFAGQPHALVDVSHGQVGLRVTGADAPAVLNGSVPLDLSLPAFPVSMCTRTICEKAEIVLWRVAADIWHVETGRSFAAYVRQLLDATARAGCQPRPSKARLPAVALQPS